MDNSKTSFKRILDDKQTIQSLGVFVVLLTGEAAIFILGSHYFVVFPTNKNLVFNLVISAVFLAATFWFKYNPRLKKHWQIPLVLFAASIAFPFTAIFDGWIRAALKWFAVTTDTSKGLAIEKVGEMVLKVLPILVVMKFAGVDFGSIFLKRGNLKQGVGIGLLVFFFLGSASFMFAAQRFTSMDALQNALVWGLVFSFANSFMEELWMRGILLKRFETLLGTNGSAWLTSIVFASMHSFVYYFMPSAIPFFFVNTLALGLACSYLMLKSDSILGSLIIHAASDFFLFLAILANA